MRYIKGTYGDVTVYTDGMAGEPVVVLNVEGDRNATIEFKSNEVDELIDALQKAKEVLSRGTKI